MFLFLRNVSREKLRDWIKKKQGEEVYCRDVTPLKLKTILCFDDEWKKETLNTEITSSTCNHDDAQNKTGVR